eukprot:s1989_g18.t1
MGVTESSVCLRNTSCECNDLGPAVVKPRLRVGCAVGITAAPVQFALAGDLRAAAGYSENGGSSIAENSADLGAMSAPPGAPAPGCGMPMGGPMGMPGMPGMTGAMMPLGQSQPSGGSGASGSTAPACCGGCPSMSEASEHWLSRGMASADVGAGDDTPRTRHLKLQQLWQEEDAYIRSLTQAASDSSNMESASSSQIFDHTWHMPTDSPRTRARKLVEVWKEQDRWIDDLQKPTDAALDPIEDFEEEPPSVRKERPVKYGRCCAKENSCRRLLAIEKQERCHLGVKNLVKAVSERKVLTVLEAKKKPLRTLKRRSRGNAACGKKARQGRQSGAKGIDASIDAPIAKVNLKKQFVFADVPSRAGDCVDEHLEYGMRWVGNWERMVVRTLLLSLKKDTHAVHSFRFSFEMQRNCMKCTESVCFAFLWVDKARVPKTPKPLSAIAPLLCVKELEPCKRLIEKANAILGYDLLDLCLNGPEDKLEETKFCQPAMFLANCCALEKLRLEKPEVVERCSATAGLSLGEYNAICFSGMLSFEECLKVVRVRADAMQEESLRSPQAMISVAGLDLAVLESLCEKAARQAGSQGEREAVCKVANHLFPKGYTCSGDKSAVELLKGLCEKEGALQARYLKTSGAFHTSLMEPAGVKLLKALRVRVTEMNFPRVDVYMNVRGAPQKAGTDPREINYDLAEQVASPVLWQASIQEMMKNGITEFYECGPMKQLKAMMKRISQEAWERTTNVSV